jgi:glycosyltransferase involved in cell wall biosynthesis
MPLSVLEAQAAGLPVVASRVGGLPELIEHGRNGLLFEAADVEALATCLNELLAHPQTATGMGSLGQQRVRERFDVAVMAETYQRHYQQLLDRREERGA